METEYLEERFWEKVDKGGEENPHSKLSRQDVEDIRERFEAETNQSLADEYGVSNGLISMIGNGQRWNDE